MFPGLELTTLTIALSKPLESRYIRIICDYKHDTRNNCINTGTRVHMLSVY